MAECRIQVACAIRKRLLSIGPQRMREYVQDGAARATYSVMGIVPYNRNCWTNRQALPNC